MSGSWLFGGVSLFFSVVLKFGAEYTWSIRGDICEIFGGRVSVIPSLANYF